MAARQGLRRLAYGGAVLGAGALAANWLLNDVSITYSSEHFLCFSPY